MWNEVTNYLNEHKIHYEPYTIDEINETLRRCGILTFPSALMEYYLNIGKTICTVNFFEERNDCENQLPLLALSEVFVQEVNDVRYLIFARNLEMSEALFIKVEDIGKENQITYSTNDTVDGTLIDYMDNLKYMILNVDEVLKSMRFYSLQETKRNECLEKALKYKNSLSEKEISDVSCQDVSIFLDNYRIKKVENTMEEINDHLDYIGISNLPELLYDYYTTIGDSVIHLAVPTKMLKLRDTKVVVIENNRYLKIIEDNSAKNDLLIRIDDSAQDPKLYRYFSDSSLRETDLTLRSYFDYLFETITRNEEWINYLSKL